MVFAGCGCPGPAAEASRRSHYGSAQPSRTSSRLAPCDLRLAVFLGGDLLTDLLERSPDEPRHMHLRDADLLGDLRLRQSFEEAQMENCALSFIEDAEPRREHCAVLRHVVLMLQRADRLERIELLAVVASAAARGERERRVGTTGLECLEHLLLFHPGSLGELRDRRRACQLHR